VSPAILAAGLLVAQQVAGKATRDAFFLSEFDVTTLPVMSGGAAIVSLLAVLAFARGMATFSPGRMVPVAVALSATLLLGEWGLSGLLPRLAAVAVYFHMVIFGPILVSGFWSLVNERFDPHAARREVARIGIGASLGGLIGGLITWRAATLIRVPTMLVGMAALNLLCLRPLFQLRPPLKAPPAEPVKSAAPAAKAVSGLRLIREVPYLRDLAFLVGLCAFIEALLDYVFTASAAAAFARGAALMSFFALFHTVIGLLTLGLQTNLVRPSLGRLGLAGTLVIQPAAMALGSVAALFFPRLWPIVVMRGSQAALRNSLFRSAYELFYTPLPQEQKRPTKAIVDVGFDRLGTAAGSAVVMGVLFLASAGPTRVLLALAAASAALALTLAPRFDRGYVAALKESLRRRLIIIDAEDVVDATTRDAVSAIAEALPAPIAPIPSEEAPRPAATPAVLADPLLDLAADLRSRDPQRIRKVLDAAPELDARLIPDVIPLLSRDDLFGAAMKSLRKAAPRCTGQLIDVLLDPGQDVVVRRRIPRVLRVTPTQRAADGLLLGLRDERLDLRYRCAQALVRMKEANPALVISRQDMVAAALREIALGVHAGRSLDHVFSILSLVLERELEIALRALRSRDVALRGTALEYLENVLPDPVRKGLWPHLGSPGPLPRSGRSHEEIRDDLLRSTVATRRSGLKRRRDTDG
jgi:hypothetical protein